MATLKDICEYYIDCVGNEGISVSLYSTSRKSIPDYIDFAWTHRSRCFVLCLRFLLHWRQEHNVSIIVSCNHRPFYSLI